MVTSRRRLLGGAAALAGAGLLGPVVGCGSTPPAERRSIVDGRPRRPAAEGTVRAVDLQSVTLDDGPRREVSRLLESFSAFDGRPLPLLQTKGLYCQVGISDDKVVWIGAVGPAFGTPPLVRITATIAAVEEQALLCEGGLVLAATPDVLRAARPGQRGELAISAAARRVVGVQVFTEAAPTTVPGATSTSTP